MDSNYKGKLIIATAITLVLFILGYFFYKIAFEISPGSYPFAERYEIDSNEKSVIDAVKKFKIDHPEFIPPDSIGLKDGRDDAREHWFFVFFYYQKENQLLNTWIRASDNGKTTFALTAVNDGTTLGNWKRINRDLSLIENEEEKKKFEQRILKKIKENLE